MDTVAIKTAPPHAPLASSMQQKHLKHNTSHAITTTTTANNNNNSSTDCLKLSKTKNIGAFFQTCKVGSPRDLFNLSTVVECCCFQASQALKLIASM